jgi:ABC-type nitrate/sulfonate/bicarbonate transport system permease component
VTGRPPRPTRQTGPTGPAAPESAPPASGAAPVEGHATPPGPSASWLGGLLALRREPPKALAVGLGLAGVATVVLVWALLTAGEAAADRVVSPALLPSPGEVAAATGSVFGERELLKSIAATLERLFKGFGLAVLVGLPFGVLAGAFRVLNAFTAPLIVFGRNVPVAALVPLTLLWFGIGEAQKAFFIFIAAVPFVVSEVSKAIMVIPERYVETAQTLGASRGQIILKVLLPHALPDVVTGLRALFGLAFGYIMLAEVINSERGLGYLLLMAQRRGDVELLVYVLLVIGVLAFLIDRTLLFFQRGLFPHRSDLH